VVVGLIIFVMLRRGGRGKETEEEI
jgi:hypothetical protein